MCFEMFRFLSSVFCLCSLWLLTRYYPVFGLRLANLQCVLRWRWNCNQYLDSWRARDVQQCRVRIYFSHRCPNLTYSGYCEEHRRLLRLEWAAYHMVNSYDLRDVPPALVALMEWEQRQAFRVKYDLSPNWGHRAWETHLQFVVNGQYEIIDGFVVHFPPEEGFFMADFDFPGAESDDSENLDDEGW